MKFSFVAMALCFILCKTNSSFSQINADSLSKHVYTLADDKLEGRSIGTKGGDLAARYIVNQFMSIGIKPFIPGYYHHFVYKTGAISSEGKNIVGIIEGSDPELRNEYIVLGAHYDHIGYSFDSGKKVVFNGADDNASGVASMIEIGRQLFRNKQLLKRSIILVAFDGEESGLNGSIWMVKDSVIPPAKIKLMMSIDMVGMLSKNEGIELYGSGTLENGKIYAQQLAAALNITIKKQTNGVANRTDTKPFGDAGIPALHITTGTVSPYHKPTDDADLLDYPGMALINNFIYDFTLKVANADEQLLVSNLSVSNEKTLKSVFKPGLMVNLGSSYHNYPDQFYRGKNGLALQAGLFSHIKLLEHWAIQPEILYQTLGSENNLGSYREHSVTTPLNILYKATGNTSFESWLAIELGAYYTFKFAGNEGGKDLDYTNTFNDYDYGMNIGFLVNISKVQIGIVRRVGFTNIYKDASIGNCSTNSVFGTIGMQF